MYVGIRPEGFLLREDGSFRCELSGIEVMGRDISVLCTNKASLNPTVRAIIGTENNINIEKLSTISVSEINTYEVVSNAVVVLTKGSVKKLEEAYC